MSPDLTPGPEPTTPREPGTGRPGKSLITVLVLYVGLWAATQLLGAPGVEAELRAWSQSQQLGSEPHAATWTYHTYSPMPCVVVGTARADRPFEASGSKAVTRTVLVLPGWSWTLFSEFWGGA